MSDLETLLAASIALSVARKRIAELERQNQKLRAELKSTQRSIGRCMIMLDLAEDNAFLKEQV
jgi:hypothetical protein